MSRTSNIAGFSGKPTLFVSNKFIFGKLISACNRGNVSTPVGPETARPLALSSLSSLDDIFPQVLQPVKEWLHTKCIFLTLCCCGQKASTAAIKFVLNMKLLHIEVNLINTILLSGQKEDFGEVFV